MKRITAKLAVFCMAMGLLAEVSPAQTSSEQSQGQYGGQNPSMTTQPSGQMMTAMRASKLIGATVTSQQGERLGRIRDVVIDPQKGQIQFAVIGTGGMAGMGESLHPLPWQELKIRSQRELVASIDKAKLQSSPTLQKEMTELQNPTYVAQVYNYYGLQPPAAMGGMGGMGGTEQGGGQTQPGSSNPNQPQQQQPQQQQQQ